MPRTKPPACYAAWQRIGFQTGSPKKKPRWHRHVQRGRSGPEAHPALAGLRSVRAAGVQEAKHINPVLFIAQPAKRHLVAGNVAVRVFQPCQK
jgi:hypothetical protein